MSFKTTGAVQHRNWNLFLGRGVVVPPPATLRPIVAIASTGTPEFYTSDDGGVTWSTTPVALLTTNLKLYRRVGTDCALITPFQLASALSEQYTSGVISYAPFVTSFSALVATGVGMSGAVVTDTDPSGSYNVYSYRTFDNGANWSSSIIDVSYGLIRTLKYVEATGNYIWLSNGVDFFDSHDRWCVSSDLLTVTRNVFAVDAAAISVNQFIGVAGTTVVGSVYDSAVPRKYKFMRSTNGGSSFSTVDTGITPSSSGFAMTNTGDTDGNGVWVSTGRFSVDTLVSIDDGVTWNVYPNPSYLSDTEPTVIWDGVEFLLLSAMGGVSNLYASVDGTDWVLRYTFPSANMFGLALDDVYIG